MAILNFLNGISSNLLKSASDPFGLSGSIGVKHTRVNIVRDEVRDREISFFARAQRFFGALAFGDVLHRHSQNWHRFIGTLNRHGGKLNGHARETFGRQREFEGHLVREFFALPKIGVKISNLFSGDIETEWYADQRRPLYAEHGCAGQIDLLDDGLGIQRDIAHRRKIVEIGIAVTRFFQQPMREAQFVVLGLQFSLMYLKFMHQAVAFRWRKDRLGRTWLGLEFFDLLD